MLTAFVLLLTAANKISAQNYTFTSSAGNVIVPGVTLVPGSQADDVTTSVAIPFPYTAYGTVYNSVNVGTNGNLQFTTTNTAFTNVCPLPAAAMGVSFFPHWDDLILTNAGEGIFTSTSGVAPNRIFNIEWRARRFAFTNPVNFEARFFEGQQRVDFIYGAIDNNGASASIGVQSFPTALQTTFSCNTASLSSGLGISFTLGTNCSGVPTSGTISGSGTACVGSTINLALSGSSTGNGISYQWKSSATPGGPYTNILGATNLAYTFTATGGTTYYIVTTTCANGGASANTPEVSVGIGAPVHSALSATVTTACSPGAATISGTVSGGLLQGSSLLGTGAGFAIPDGNAAGVNSTIILPANTFTAASDLKVRLNIAHTWIGDLKITLTSPCGTTFLLDRPGVPAGTFGNSADFNGIYTFDLTAATIIPESGGGPVIAPGNYLPSNSANPGVAHNWAGVTFPCAAAGSWILNISDNAGGDVGTLTSWQILGPPVYTHTLTGPGTIGAPVLSGPNNSTASFGVTNLPFGTHTFTLLSTDAIGCSVLSTVTATINQTPIITLVPSPTATICNGVILPITATSVVAPALPKFSQGASTLIPAGSPSITAGTANPYPSLINASGLPATGVTVKSVKLGNFNHTFPADVDVVLVSPTGQAVIIMSDAGGGAAVAGLDYTFDNAAATSMVAGFNAQGTYKPTNLGVVGGDNWPAPGPLTAPTSTTLSTFTGDPNGNWQLYVVDDANGDFGFIGNWEITFSIPYPTTVSFSPITELFTDAAATIPYSGQQTGAVWAKPTASRIYTATSTINGCTTTATLNVTVNQLPAITLQPISTSTLCPGNNVTFSVNATGTGPLTYQWRQGAVNLVNNVQISGATTNTLTIANINASNSGSYTCVVSGLCPPPAISNAAILTVATAPVISAQPANATVCVGSNSSFTVGTVGSVPTPTIYQWQVMIPSAPGVWTNLTTGGSYTPTFTITGALLTQHNNQYRVLVTNSCGQTTTSNAATLTVNALSVVTAAALPSRICISDTLVPLSGSPVGGSWSGIGVSGFNFVPSATAVGTYTLTYSFTNAAGCTATSSVVAKVEDCQERLRLLSDDGVIVYPNPNNGRFNIRINSTLYNYLGMKIYDNQGQLVNGYTVNGTVVNRILVSPIYTGLVYGRVIPVDLTRLPVGIYQVMLYYDDGVRTSQKTFSVVIPGH